MNQQANSAATEAHPLAGTRMTGADIVVQVLADEGVDTLFGYSGGAILPTYDAVFRYNDAHRTADGKPAIHATPSPTDTTRPCSRTRSRGV